MYEIHTDDPLENRHRFFYVIEFKKAHKLLILNNVVTAISKKFNLIISVLSEVRNQTARRVIKLRVVSLVTI